jgi:hypothetical protein
MRLGQLGWVIAGSLALTCPFSALYPRAALVRCLGKEVYRRH